MRRTFCGIMTSMIATESILEALKHSVSPLALVEGILYRGQTQVRAYVGCRIFDVIICTRTKWREN